jgi:hypothetical protein
VTAPKPRLRDVEARAAAATEGPWSVSGGLHGNQTVHTEGSGERGEQFVADTGDPHYEGTVSDATFIAASRTDVPAMAAGYRAALAVHAEHIAPLVRAGRTGACQCVGCHMFRALSEHIDLEEES